MSVSTVRPNWLCSSTKTTGSFHRLAMFIASWQMPVWAAPSPKMHMETELRPSTWLESAAPAAAGIPAPTMALPPIMPLEASADEHVPCPAPATAGGAPEDLRDDGINVQALADVVGVAAMRAHDVIVVIEHRRGADTDRFLTIATVNRPARPALLVQRAQLLLELPDHVHLAIHFYLFIDRWRILHANPLRPILL